MLAFPDLLGSFDSLNGTWTTLLSQVPRDLLEDERIVGIPRSLKQILLSHHRELRSADYSEPRTFSSGCNDAFSVFGFLAFLLALLDLIMEMNGGARKKRDAMNHPEFREGALASYSMFRGFLNAMDAETPACSKLFICEAAVQASKRGQTGFLVAKAAR